MHIYSSYYKRRYNRSLISRFMPLLVIAITLGGIIFLFNRATTTPLVSPLALAQSPQNHTNVRIEPTLTVKTAEELEKIIIAQLDESIPRYSIIVDDFLRPLKVELGDQIPFEGASIHKIPILLAVVKEIEQGKLTWDKAITFEERDRQDYGTGSMRYQRAGKEYTIKQLAELMMRQSDNTAAYIFANRILSMSKIQSAIESWGLTETSMEQNMTTNSDMNNLLRQLFIGKLFSASYTREAINLMENSIYEDRLPALLPKGTKVYHKIGTAIAGLHDVGIVVTPTSMYYIGVFTKGVSDEPNATKTIARISKAVFDYIEK